MKQTTNILLIIKILFNAMFGIAYSTLLLYMTHELKLNDISAIALLSSFLSYAAISRLLGGWIGDKLLSYRLLLLLGSSACILGSLALSTGKSSFLVFGITALSIGSGLIVAINCLLTQMFPCDHTKREKAFLINYSGMNIGWFVGFFISGYFQLNYAYNKLFVVSALFGVLALVTILYNWNQLQANCPSTSPVGGKLNKQYLFKGISLIAISSIAIYTLMNYMYLHQNIYMFATLIVGASLIMYALKQPSQDDKKRIFIFLSFAMLAVIFWTIYHLTPLVLTLFYKRNVNLQCFGWRMTPQWIQMISTFVVMIGGPLLIVLFSRTKSTNANFITNIKLSLAIILIGSSMLILGMGITFANPDGYINFNWVIVSAFITGFSELFMGPIGFSVIGLLAPKQSRGLLMGCWMLTIAVGSNLSGYLSKIILNDPISSDPLITNPHFAYIFNLIGWLSILIGIASLIIVPLISRLMHSKSKPLTEMAYA